MMEKVSRRYNILYIGSNEQMIRRFIDYGYFDIVQKENPLAATYWLTDNQFRLFDQDNDTRFDKQYEEKHLLDAVICELVLPGINALSYYKRLKFNKLYQKTPFIVISFFKDYIAKMNAYSMGVDDFYHQNIIPEHIYNRITLLKKFKSEVENKTIVIDTSGDLTPYKTPLLKRTFDMVVACMTLIVLSPLMILTIIAIRIEVKTHSKKLLLIRSSLPKKS